MAASGIEETAPIGPVAQPPFLNQMVLLETTLDLDIVRYGTKTVRSPELTIPHPELPNRDFWQREIAELEREHG